MQLEESLSELRRQFSDEMAAIEATLARSIADQPRPTRRLGPNEATRLAAATVDRDAADHPPEGLRIENFVSGVATK